MGKSRAERTWPRPASTRHAWARARDMHPQQPPDPCVIVCWRRRGGVWEALCVIVRVQSGQDPVVIQRWVSSRDLRPVPADPNQAFGLR